METPEPHGSVATETRPDSMQTSPTRAVPEYIPPADPVDETPIYPGSELTEEPEEQPRARRRRRTPAGTDLAALLLRWALGGYLVVRGSQVVFGWFGGQGGLTLASQLQTLGYRHFAGEATSVGIAAVVIGALLVMGLFTEWACGALLALSICAVLAQHRLGSGVLSHPGTGIGATMPGLELVAGLGVLAVVLALLGAGRLSLDHNRFWTRVPLFTAVIALLLGVAVGAVLIQPQLA